MRSAVTVHLDDSLAEACTHLDPDEEVELGEAGVERDTASWSPYGPID